MIGYIFVFLFLSIWVLYLFVIITEDARKGETIRQIYEEKKGNSNTRIDYSYKLL